MYWWIFFPDIALVNRMFVQIGKSLTLIRILGNMEKVLFCFLQKKIPLNLKNYDYHIEALVEEHKPAKWGVPINYLFCSCQEAKIRHDVSRLNKFEEQDIFLILLMAFTKVSLVFFVSLQFFQETWNYEENGSKITQVFLQNTSFFARQTDKFVNYVKNSCAEYQVSGVKHRENTCLVCTSHWLHSEE